MNKLYSNCILIVSFLLVFSGCSREKDDLKAGCMDTDAINYCIDCKRDDHSCQYQGSLLFWYGENTALGLVNDGAVSLTYYVDGNIVGSGSADIYWTGVPDCNQQGTITVTKNLGSSKNESYSYSIIDQTGWKYYEGTAYFAANTCRKIELTWTKSTSKK